MPQPPRIVLVAAGGIVLSIALLLGACTRSKTVEKQALEPPAVSVNHPRLQEVKDTFSVIGSVQAANELTVVSETSGRIVSLTARTGAAVAPEAPLAQVDKDLREAAMIAAEAAHTKAARDVERVAALHADRLLSDADLEAARLGEATTLAQYLVAKKELENTTVRAAIGGTIADVYVSVGEQLAPGSRVAMIVDTSRLKVRVMLPERIAVRHRSGDGVEVTSDLFPDRAFKGRIDFVGVRGDETHSFPAEVTLLGDAAAALRAGMSVRLVFAGAAGRKALVIPRAAIVGSIRDPEVFVVVGGTAVRKKIVAGEEYGTDIEVRGGLTESDSLVTSGQTLLSDRQAVTVVSSGAGT